MTGPLRFVSSSIVRPRLSTRSWSDRGTRTIHWPRKWRFSSPSIVGIGEVGERDAEVRVEALDGLHQPEERDLLEVLDRLAAAAVPAGERAGEVPVLDDQRVPDPTVAGAGVRREPIRRALGARTPIHPERVCQIRRSGNLRHMDFILWLIAVVLVITES